MELQIAPQGPQKGPRRRPGAPRSIPRGSPNAPKTIFGSKKRKHEAKEKPRGHRPKGNQRFGVDFEGFGVFWGVLEGVQEGKRPSEGSPRGLRMTVEDVFRRKGQNFDLYNTSKLISPFVTWGGPSK